MSRQRRYPSDLTDAQWALVEPLPPAPNTGGRPEKHSRRDLVDAILYVVRTGCSWRQLPVEFPPWQTVYWYFIRWEEAQVTERMLVVLRRRVPVAQGRAGEPMAGIIDSQSVKGADTVPSETRGFGAGKKINGCKRFIRLSRLNGSDRVPSTCLPDAQPWDRCPSALTISAAFTVGSTVVVSNLRW